MALSLLVTACDDGDTINQPNSAFQVSSDSVDYELQNHWQFLGIQKSGSSGEVLPDDLYTEISFFKDNTVESGLCNSYEGTYTFTNDYEIDLSLSTTFKYCENLMDWEEKYLNGLSSTSSYSIDGDILRITTTDNTNLYFRYAGEIEE